MNKEKNGVLELKCYRNVVKNPVDQRGEKPAGPPVGGGGGRRVASTSAGMRH